MKIINVENIYIENHPKYICLYYKDKIYVIIMERISYRDFIFYYHSDTIPDEKTKEEIESFLYEEFLDYEKWNI